MVFSSVAAIMLQTDYVVMYTSVRYGKTCLVDLFCALDSAQFLNATLPFNLFHSQHLKSEANKEES